MARKGEGKRGGYRTLLAYKKDKTAIFLFGFSKNEKDNIDEEQLKKLKNLSKEYINLPDHSLEKLKANDHLIEVQ